MFLRGVLLLCLLHVCGGTPDLDREMCYSRQHRDVAVNTHVALGQKGTVMVARAKPSEKDCILTCCSEDVASGLKCNLVVYKPPEHAGDLNCELFHCPSERDCPLMTAKPGVNTYNIFKGLTHPTTKGSGRITAKPAAPQLTMTTLTTTPTTITTPTTTTTTTTTTTPMTTPTTPATAPATTTTTTTTPTTPAPTTSTTSSSEATEAALTESESPEMLETVAMTTASTTTATSTTQSSSTKSSSTKAPRTSIKPNRPKKPSKPSRPETHSVKPVRFTPTPTSSTPPTTPATTTTTTTTTTTPATTTTTTTPATTTTKTTTTTTTTTTISTTTTTTSTSTAALIELESDPKRRDFSRPVLSLPAKPKVSRVMWKNSLVAIVVITLVFLALILSLVARKAVESFDRRHYTRLELNDLHYEV